MHGVPVCAQVVVFLQKPAISPNRANPKVTPLERSTEHSSQPPHGAISALNPCIMSQWSILVEDGWSVCLLGAP
jgi:hypothetical protein